MIVTRPDALPHADLADPDLLQELLFGLHAVIRLHLWKEEEIYFPLLDADTVGIAAERILGATAEPERNA